MNIISTMRKYLDHEVLWPFRTDGFELEDRVGSLGPRDFVSSFMPAFADRKLDDYWEAL